MVAAYCHAGGYLGRYVIVVDGRYRCEPTLTCAVGAHHALES